MNINRKGEQLIKATRDFMLQSNIQILAMQEVDVGTLASHAAHRAWKSQGCKIILSKPEAVSLKHRVALISSVPVCPVDLQLDFASTRCAAGLVEICLSKRPTKVLVVSFYGFPDDHLATGEALDEIHLAICRYGGPFVLLGDFNLQVDEGRVRDMLMDGRAKCLDEDFHFQQLPCTGPKGTRRIDYALSSRGIAAKALRHFQGLGDHVVPAYDLAEVSAIGEHALPERPPITRDCPQAVARFFQEHWDDKTFQGHLNMDQLDEAWACLSRAAEHALCEQPDRGTRRDEAFTPCAVLHKKQRIGVRGHESATLQRLRRLNCRLNQLVLNPDDPQLRVRIQKSLTGLRAAGIDVPFQHFENFELLRPDVARILQDFEQQEQNIAIAMWRARVRNNSNAQIAWVKRRADESLEFEKPYQTAQQAPRAIHPVSFLNQQAEIWGKKWTAVPRSPTAASDLSAILKSLPRPSAPHVSLTFDAESLRAANKAMFGKAPGPDSWMPEHLHRLPDNFWSAAAMLWAKALALGRLPKRWTEATVSLIPKKIDEARPICLANILWRCGARVLAHRLRPWLTSFIDERSFGGAPGRSVIDAHLKVLQAVHDGVSEFIFEDLSAFFDSLTMPVLRPILQHLRAPQQLVNILQAFYVAPMRLFRYKGVVRPTWHQATAGIMQGCPLSPMLALCVGHIWAQFSASAKIETLCFVDDRLLWMKPGVNDVPAFRAALGRSSLFDKACGLQCRPNKCAYIAKPGCVILARLANEKGYPHMQELPILGVRLDLNTGDGAPLKLDLKKAIHRLQAVRTLDPAARDKFRLARTLVFSMTFWCAGVAHLDQAGMQALRQAMKATFHGNFTFEVPSVVRSELIGWEADPQFCSDKATLRCAWRMQCKRHPHPVSQHKWFVVLGGARELLARLGWQAAEGGSCIQRFDDEGRSRVFRFGWDNFKIVEAWLTEHHRAIAVHQCGRVRMSLHRPDPGLARGLELPPPPRRSHFDFSAHRIIHMSDTSLALHRAAAVSGGSFWYHKPAQSRQLPDHHPGELCMCGLKRPSRAHLTWSCEATQHLRHGVRAPTNRAEERLFTTHIKEFPPAPQASGVASFQQSVSQALDNALSDADGNPVILATDGSSKHSVSAFACVIQAYPAPARIAAAHGAEDQTSFQAECFALHAVATAVSCVASRGRRGQIMILCDCRAAIQHAVAVPESLALPLLAASLQSSLSHASQQGLYCELHWVPSHGKMSSWKAPPGLDDVVCRELNAIADREAGILMERRRLESARSQWFRSVEDARQWATTAIRISAEASEQYRRFLSAA